MFRNVTPHDPQCAYLCDRRYRSLCRSHIPGAVPYTSTLALTNATLPYVIALANKGWKKACKDDPALALGLNVVEGKVVYKAVADVFDLKYENINL